MSPTIPCHPASWARFHPCAATNQSPGSINREIAGPAFRNPATAPMAKINNKPDKKYSVRVMRPEKEKGALNIEKQGLTPKLPYYNPGYRIISHPASFLIDNERFIRDFCAIRKALSILVLAPASLPPLLLKQSTPLS